MPIALEVTLTQVMNKIVKKSFGTVNEVCYNINIQYKNIVVSKYKYRFLQEFLKFSKNDKYKNM